VKSIRLCVAVIAAAACLMTMFAAQTAQAQTYKVLYSFGSDGGDGGRPYAGVIQGTEGNFYGTNAVFGDPSCLQDGCGTVFKPGAPDLSGRKLGFGCPAPCEQ
jgi:hypothetical protein